MKLTVAAAAIASSISASAESLQDTAGKSGFDVVEDTTRARHRSLADEMESQRQVTSMFKGRRDLKNRNGRIARNIQNRLRLKNSELRNQAEGGDISASEDELDLGFFSRKLQTNTTSNEQDEDTRFDLLLDLCEYENPEYGLTCLCSGVDKDQYSINVICSYEQNTCISEENSCGDYEDFCYSKTIEQELTAPENGYAKVCYDVLTPIKQSYCYGITYDTEESKTDYSCKIEFDGTQCNSCTFDDDYDCRIYDCTNIDNVVGAGSVCGYNETLWHVPVNNALLYAPLPCEGGCNICPENGEMTDVMNTVEYAGKEYFCYEVLLFGLMGYLKDQPGDMCTSLTPLVNEPCGCTAVEQTLIDADEDGDVTIVNGPANDVGGGSSTSSATISSFIGGFAIAAAANSIFSWMMA